MSETGAAGVLSRCEAAGGELRRKQPSLSVHKSGLAVKDTKQNGCSVIGVLRAIVTVL